jgi:hypothetical protein
MDGYWVEEESEGDTVEMDAYLDRQEQALMETPVWQYDNQTWAAITSLDVASGSSDPVDYCLTYEEVKGATYHMALGEMDLLRRAGDEAGAEARRQWYCAVEEAQDSKAMGSYLGPVDLYLLRRDRDRPQGPPVEHHPLTVEEFRRLVGRVNARSPHFTTAQ